MVGIVQTMLKHTTEGMVAVGFLLILGLVVYGLFQLAKYLMGNTVSDAKSRVVGNWYADSHNRETNRDLITFTKCVSAFVFALLLYTVLYT